MTSNKTYIDETGANVFVSPGIGNDGKTWIVARRKNGKGTKRGN